MIRKHSGFLAAAICSILCFTTLKTYAMSEGYVLTGAYGGTSTMLLGSQGNVEFKWDHSTLENPKNGYSCYLLKNGNLLRSASVPDGSVIQSMAPIQGIIQEIDRDGNIVWSYKLADNNEGMLHHDMKIMPNGNIIGVVFVPLTKTKMIEKGIDTVLLKGMTGTKFILSEKIIEIDPKAEGGPKIIWEWCIHDHVIPDAQAADHPELISGSIVNAPFYTNQWVHLNGIDYNAELDMILFSSRVFSECFIIDHGTTTQEAAGHTGGARGKGGDILYRWGNPANYKATGATKITVLHCVNWIPNGYPGAGNIIFFHNNTESQQTSHGSARTCSQVIEIKPPMDAQGKFEKTAAQPYAPTTPTWLFAPTDTFFSSFAMSSAFRMPNGNTLAHVAYPPSTNSSPWSLGGSSMICEIDKNKNFVWKYTLKMEEATTNPGMGMMQQSFNPAKIMYYNKDYEGVKKLLNNTSIQDQKKNRSSMNPVLTQSSGLIHISGIDGAKVDIINMQGKKIRSVKVTSNSLELSLHGYSAGHYYARIVMNNRTEMISTFNVIK
ncbi:MAG: aryl-sulfate sulfotransferase [Chitinispirillaceae bacterium]|nr:aryl-sulfate sulfotransferase [Chitinispirillaceae bacterium]